jgi:hypothetical protein
MIAHDSVAQAANQLLWITVPNSAMPACCLQGIQPTVAPPYSCRSGLSVLLQGNSGQNSTLVQPFSLNINRKVIADDKYHVASLQPRTMQQVGIGKLNATNAVYCTAFNVQDTTLPCSS